MEKLRRVANERFHAKEQELEQQLRDTEEKLTALQAKSAGPAAASAGGSFGIDRGGLDAKSGLFWAFVGIPILWGAWITLSNEIVIFQ